MPLFQLIDAPLCLQIQDRARLEKLFRKLFRAFKDTDLLAALSVKAALYELLRFIWTEESKALRLTPTSPKIYQHDTTPISVIKGGA
jgi:hypothetical protein